MATPIPSRRLPELVPQNSSHPGIRVRVAAAAFIPWSWVELPPNPLPGGGSGVGYFVHGDGRLPAARSDAVGSRFRTLGVIEVDVLERPGETFAALADNQPSLGELRGPGGRVLKTNTGRGPVTSALTATRLTPTSVLVGVAVGGSVPWNVAGPQPAIDFSYHVELAYDPAANTVKWSASASHDGFPGHEFFLESGGRVRFNKPYLPSFFSTPGTGTARPSIPQAVAGAAALGGVRHAQRWTGSGRFTP